MTNGSANANPLDDTHPSAETPAHGGSQGDNGAPKDASSRDEAPEPSSTTSWGLEVTVAGRTAQFGAAESLALWMVARASELQSGSSATVDGATEALVRELARLASQGDPAPLSLLIQLSTTRIAEAAGRIDRETMFSRTWEQLSAGAPAALTEALPEYLSLLEQAIDGTASGTVNLDLRPTVLCAIAVWAALLADPTAAGWDALLALAGANDAGRITSIDGEVSLRLAL